MSVSTITIEEDDFLLDLAGATVDAPNDNNLSSAVRINSNLNNVTIRNGTLRGGAATLRILENCSDVVLENLLIENFFVTGILSSNCSNLVLRNVSISSPDETRISQEISNRPFVLVSGITLLSPAVAENIFDQPRQALTNRRTEADLSFQKLDDRYSTFFSITRSSDDEQDNNNVFFKTSFENVTIMGLNRLRQIEEEEEARNGIVTVNGAPISSQSCQIMLPFPSDDIGEDATRRQNILPEFPNEGKLLLYGVLIDFDVEVIWITADLRIDLSADRTGLKDLFQRLFDPCKVCQNLPRLPTVRPRDPRTERKNDGKLAGKIILKPKVPFVRRIFRLGDVMIDDALQPRSASNLWKETRSVNIDNDENNNSNNNNNRNRSSLIPLSVASQVTGGITQQRGQLQEGSERFNGSLLFPASPCLANR